MIKSYKELNDKAVSLKKRGICPHCWKSLDAATVINHPNIIKPKPGDLTCCVYCREFAQFDAQLDLVSISEETLRLLPPGTLRELAEARDSLRHFEGKPNARF
mgnify:CR=1 FL=1